MVNFLGTKIKHDNLQFITHPEFFSRSHRGHSRLSPSGYATAKMQLNFTILKTPSRGNGVWTTFPRLLHSSVALGIQTYNLPIASPTPYRRSPHHQQAKIITNEY